MKPSLSNILSDHLGSAWPSDHKIEVATLMIPMSNLLVSNGRETGNDAIPRR